MKRDIIIFYIFSFLVGFYLANGTTVLFARVLGFSYQQIFILGAVYMLMFILFEIPSGALADLIGRKKSIVAGCLVLTAAAILTGVSQTFTQVFLSFFVWALGFSFISGADEALLYDHLADHDSYRRVLGRAHFFMLGGTALAGVLGPYLFSLNFRFAYLASALPFFSAGIAISFFEERLTKKPFSLKSHLTQIKNGIRLAFQNKHIRWAIYLMSLAFAVWYNLSNSYQPFLRDIGFSVRAFSLILPVLFVSEALGAGILEKLYGFWGENRVLILSLLAIGLSLGLAGLWATKPTLLLIFTYSFFLGILRPAISTYSNRYIESSHRATVISAQAMMATVTASLTLFLFGFLTDRIGLNNLFGLLGVIILSLSTILFWIKPEEKHLT